MDLELDLWLWTTLRSLPLLSEHQKCAIARRTIVYFTSYSYLDADEAFLHGPNVQIARGPDFSKTSYSIYSSQALRFSRSPPFQDTGTPELFLANTGYCSVWKHVCLSAMTQSKEHFWADLSAGIVYFLFLIRNISFRLSHPFF